MDLELNASDDSKELIMSWIVGMPDEKADHILVEMTAHEMRKKLAKKRANGRFGWFGPSIENTDLELMLESHVEAGDMVDVINIAAMILARQKLYGDTA